MTYANNYEGEVNPKQNQNGEAPQRGLRAVPAQISPDGYWGPPFNAYVVGGGPQFIMVPRIRLADVQALMHTPSAGGDPNITAERFLRQWNGIIAHPILSPSNNTHRIPLSFYTLFESPHMGGTVQARYTSTENPTYGPLSVPTPKSHIIPQSHLAPCIGFYHDREETRNYSSLSKPSGRQSGDAREPMPKLGQGDARLHPELPFGKKKIDSKRRSPPTINYSARHPSAKVSIQTALDSKANMQSIQRPGPLLINGTAAADKPAPEKAVQAKCPPKAVRNFNYQNPEIKESHFTHDSWYKGAYSNAMDGYKTSNTHRFNARAPAFQPSISTTTRTHPTKLETQCKWSSNCRLGFACTPSDHGNEYSDKPDMRHSHPALGQASNQVALISKQKGKSSFNEGHNIDGFQIYRDSLLRFTWLPDAVNTGIWMEQQRRVDTTYGVETRSEALGKPMKNLYSKVYDKGKNCQQQKKGGLLSSKSAKNRTTNCCTPHTPYEPGKLV